MEAWCVCIRSCDTPTPITVMDNVEAVVSGEGISTSLSRRLNSISDGNP